MPEEKIKPGETRRYDCVSCDACFELTYEPNMADATPTTIKGSGFKDRDVLHCPFCQGVVEES